MRWAIPYLSNKFTTLFIFYASKLKGLHVFAIIIFDITFDEVFLEDGVCPDAELGAAL